MATNNLDTKATSQYIQLLTFTWAAGVMVARYAASDKPYTDLVPNTFAEAPAISVDLGKQTGGVADEPATILMPVLDPVTTMLVGYPFSPCTVLIEEIDITDATTRRRLFFGTISQCTGNKNGNSALCEIKVAGLRSFLDYPLGIPALNTCAWQFGDKNCTVNVVGLEETRTIATISGTTVTLTTDLTSIDIVFGDFNKGFLTYQGISILIRSQTSFRVIELVNAPPPAWAGQAVVLRPGCRKTISDCQKWNNLINFGGFGIAIPAFNPTTEVQ